MKKALSAAATFFTGLFCLTAATLADDGVGKPVDGGITFQGSVTETMDRITDFHDGILMPIITVITIFVLGLIGYVMFRFREKANPTPSKTTHNIFIEVVWTVVPIVILVIIGIPSFRLLYFQDVVPEADMVIQATGNQWYWTYEYIGEDGLMYDSTMVPSAYWDKGNESDLAEAKAGIQRMIGNNKDFEMQRLLETDTRVVVPVDTTVKLIVTASDVLHAWTIPSFGIKIDAVPGRANETWFKAREVGTYYGQCSELCGPYHAFMPIAVEVVSKADYQQWLARAKTIYASNSQPANSRLAVAQ